MEDGNLIEMILDLAQEVKPDHASYTVVQAAADYIRSLSFVKHKETKNRLQAYIAADCDYSKTLDILLTQDSDTTRESLRTTLWYANKLLRKKLGNDIFDLLLKQPDLARLRLQLAEGAHTEDVLLQDTQNSLPDFKYLRFPLEDCKKELLFLARFSRPSLNYFKSQMDSQKLAYLSHLLSTPSTEELPTALSLISWLSSTQMAKPADLDRLFSSIDSTDRLREVVNSSAIGYTNSIEDVDDIELIGYREDGDSDDFGDY